MLVDSDEVCCVSHFEASMVVPAARSGARYSGYSASFSEKRKLGVALFFGTNHKLCEKNHFRVQISFNRQEIIFLTQFIVTFVNYGSREVAAFPRLAPWG